MTPGANELPRLLTGLVSSGPLSLTVHESLHGRLPQSHGLELLEQIELSGLRGMGGGSFPTATKIGAVAAQAGSRAVIVNVTEGEPLSHKDRLLVSRLPHLVLDGAVVAATMVGADELVVAFDEASPGVGRVLERALAERPEMGGRRGLAAAAVAVPSGYLTGQETALINVLDGGEPKPSLAPPYPFERGLGRRPTLVSNAETFAQLALIARHGAEWYRAIGTDSAPGSRLITVSGAIAEPGVIEVAGGTEMRTLLRVAGGEMEPVQGLLLGGYSGTWVGPGGLDLVLDEGWLRAHGMTLGAGMVFVLPDSACPVAEVARVADWMRSQSAGQCGPCIHGLDAIAGALCDLTERGDRHRTFQRVERWCEMVTRRGACAHPDGVARFVDSAVRTFRESFEDHARHGRCEACTQRPWSPLGRSRERTAA